jgi:hypothetical protein
MILASHGLIASSISGVDADWLAYYNRVISAGGSLTTTEQNATKQLVADLKANSLWTPMKAIYPMVGASAAACAQNLKSSSFTGTFTSGWTFASTGVTPNGTSAYMDTNLTPSTSLSQNSASIGFYGGNNLGALLDKRAMGAWSTSPNKILGIEPTLPGYGLFGDVNDGSGTFTTNTNSSGFIFASRNSSTTKIHSIRGVQTNKTENSTGLPTVTVILGAIRKDTIIMNYSAFQHRLSFIGDGLDSTEASNFYTAVQTFQTTLSRNV